MTDVSQLLESRRTRIGRWAGAAFVVCGLHVAGLALGLMQWPEDDVEDPAAGALTVEMTPLPAAVPVDSPDLPPGPVQEEAKLTPEAAKEVVEKVQEDIPPVEPSPAPDPEVALPKAQPVEKEQPKEEEPKEAAAAEQAPQQDADIPITTAPPRIEAPPAPSAAPSPVPSPSLARAQAQWERLLFRHIERHKIDPSSKWRGLTGRAYVRFKIDESGQLISSEITRSAGRPLLDEAALRLLKRSNPFPRPPAGVLGDFNIQIDLK